MRRISLGVILLLFVSSITQADYNYTPLNYRVQYNPYAFGYHSNGLVPGGIQYTPYAFKPRTSGLVFEGVRYIPYAFTYKSTGLVLDYYYYPIPYAAYPPCPPQAYAAYAGVPPYGNRAMNRPPRYYNQNGDTAPPTEVNEPGASAEREDAMAIIRQYLRQRRLSDVTVNRILRINNKLVSADFTLGSRKLLIKYWDPAQIQSPEAKADSQPVVTNSRESRAIDRYKKDWETFSTRYQQGGGEIYVVAASGRTDIIAALDACEKLGPVEVEPSPEPKYVKQ